MNIRSETLDDHFAIALIHVRAFEERISEALIVALHHHRPHFDPDLSLVAEIDEQVVGHALFSPQTLRLLGQHVQAVNLAPVAVDPARQRQGIGTALIEEGHNRARQKGYALSFLLGHPTYYPRFGYQTHAYGSSSVKVKMTDLDEAIPLEVRAPGEADLPLLQELWRHEEGNVDFAIEPGAALLDWLSPHPQVATQVYLRDGSVVGYSRSGQHGILAFHAHDDTAARSMAFMLAGDASTIDLPLHPNSASATAFITVPTCTAWEAGMALSLEPNSFDGYYRQVQAGDRLAGRVIWPVVFDVA